MPSGLRSPRMDDDLLRIEARPCEDGYRVWWEFGGERHWIGPQFTERADAEALAAELLRLAPVEMERLERLAESMRDA